jgi:hypothetical protein
MASGVATVWLLYVAVGQLPHSAVSGLGLSAQPSWQGRVAWWYCPWSFPCGAAGVSPDR